MRGTIKIAIGLVVAASGVGAVVLFKKYHKSKEPVMTMADVEQIMIEKRIAEEFKVPDEVPESSVEELELFKKFHTVGDGESSEEEEGEKDMKKGTDPNSSSALDQYINSKLADYINEEQEILLTLFRFKFEPHNMADRVLYEAICDEKTAFFGPYSKHINNVTWADLIIHYIDKIHYHLGDEPERLAAYILSQLDISMASNDYEIADTFEEVASHVYTNKDTGLFGIFGIDDDGFEKMQEQIQYSVEKKYSFEMEFQAFLGMSMANSEE